MSKHGSVIQFEIEWIWLIPKMVVLWKVMVIVVAVSPFAKTVFGDDFIECKRILFPVMFVIFFYLLCFNIYCLPSVFNITFFSFTFNFLFIIFYYYFPMLQFLTFIFYLLTFIFYLLSFKVFISSLTFYVLSSSFYILFTIPHLQT